MLNERPTQLQKPNEQQMLPFRPNEPTLPSMPVCSFIDHPAMHRSLAFMTLAQGILHSTISWQTGDKQIQSMISQTIVFPYFIQRERGTSDREQAAVSLLALSVLPLIRRYGYEVFLWSHRMITINLSIALWWHVQSSQTRSRTLLVVAFGGILASTVCQSLSQLYKNTAWHGRGVSIVRTRRARRSGDCVIVKIQLRRPWVIQPGEFIYLRLLTLKIASIFQRHPFVIIWWERSDAVDDRDDARLQPDFEAVRDSQTSARKAEVIYVMIDPQHGWTRNVTKNLSAFDNQSAWLDGPFGFPYRLEEYNTVVLFASDLSTCE